MFFRGGDKNRELYKSDPLWAVVMSQLKSQTLGLTPFFRAGELNGPAADPLVGYQRFETILSQIEDGYHLNNLLILKRSKLRNTRLNQIVEDISENYDRRFSSLSDSRVLLLVDRELPPIKTHPSVLMQAVDCLIRATQRLSSETGARLTIRRNDSARNTAGEIAITIECAGLVFGVESSRISKSLAKFNSGKYADSVNDFGIDICAAFHLAKQLGANIAFDFSRSDGASFKIDFIFELSDEAAPKEPATAPFYLYTNSELTCTWIRKVAEFHRVELHECSRLADLPKDAHLLYDILSGVSVDLFAGEASGLPAKTVFLAQSRDIPALRGASGGRFKRMLTMPLASTKLLRCLFAPLTEVESSSEVSGTVRPLRILVVDDTETARIAIQDHLESKGHTVVEACDGSEFIERIKRGEQYDLAICDINMVHIDGMTAARTIRELERGTGRELKIALMTAFKATEKEEPAALGVNAMLDKPVRPEDLDRLLSDLFKS